MTPRVGKMGVGETKVSEEEIYHPYFPGKLTIKSALSRTYLVHMDIANELIPI